MKHTTPSIDRVFSLFSVATLTFLAWNGIDLSKTLVISIAVQTLWIYKSRSNCLCDYIWHIDSSRGTVLFQDKKNEWFCRRSDRVLYTVNGFQMVGSKLFSTVKPAQKIYWSDHLNLGAVLYCLHFPKCIRWEHSTSAMCQNLVGCRAVIYICHQLLPVIKWITSVQSHLVLDGPQYSGNFFKLHRWGPRPTQKGARLQFALCWFR